MKRKAKIFRTTMAVLCIVVSLISNAQPNCQWSKGYGNANEDFGVGISVDGSGNVYSIGFFNSPYLTFGSTTLPNVDIYGTSSDVFIVKSDSCGNVIWANKAGDQEYDDRGIAITTDKNGNVYATGSYYSYYIKFGSDSLANTGTGWGTYIVKYSPAGNVLWSKDLDATNSIFPSELAVDKNGDLILSGYYMSDTVKMDNVTLLGNTSQNKSFIAKFNGANGNTLWAKDAEYGSNRALALALDTLGGIFVAGGFYDSLKIENTVVMGQQNLNAYYAKYNSSGNLVWLKGAGHNYDDEAYGITIDPAGNIFITGYLQSDSINFGNNVKLQLLPSTLFGNAFLLKCDGNGNALWAKRIGGLTEDYGESVVTNAAGDVFIGGYFRSSSFSVDGVTLTNASGSNTTYDLFLAKYNSNGQLKWIKKAGGAGNDFLESMALAGNGIPHVTGEFASSSIAFAEHTLTNNGMDDIFITNDINRIGVPVPQLCEVTVDSISLNNEIYWDKTPYGSAERFIVYREIATNNYKPIASVHADSLSMFVDTERTKYFPNTGDPNVGTYRYKLQLLDTAGNFSLLGPYHNTIYIVDNGSGQFTWNPSYTIENGSNPVNNYVLKRDNNGTGTWTIVGSITGSQNTIADPQYSSYPSGKWRVEADWNISCTPTRGSISTTRSNIKSSAISTSITDQTNPQLHVYPNPAKEAVTIEYSSGSKNIQLQIINALGQVVYQEQLERNPVNNNSTMQVDVHTLTKGIYTISIQTETGKTFQRVAIQ